jgi:hypothetical protein
MDYQGRAGVGSLTRVFLPSVAGRRHFQRRFVRKRPNRREPMIKRPDGSYQVMLCA